MPEYFVRKSGSAVSYQPVDAKVILTKVQQGPPGPPGTSAAASHEHQQTTPAAAWTVNHNLGFKPAVTLLSVGGREMLGEVIHTSTNQFIAYFDAPLAGIAICS